MLPIFNFQVYLKYWIALVFSASMIVSAPVVAWQAEQQTPESTEKQVESGEQQTEQAAGTKVLRSKIDIPDPVALSQQYKDDLQHYLTPSQVTPLLAGAQDFITLIEPDQSSNHKGVAILLPDWQQGATSPKALNFLRQKFPHQGWTTITIQPFDKPENYPSIAITDALRLEQNKEILDQYQQQLSAMMRTVMDQAKNYPGIFLVVAEGNHGALLADLYQQEKNELPNALILLSAYMLTDQDNQLFAQNVAQSELPVLDLFLKLDHPLALHNATKRRALAKQEFKTYYRQRQLNNYHTGYYPRDDLLIAINGWLKSIGW